jgi:small subunit ribosomal protein S16
LTIKNKLIKLSPLFSSISLLFYFLIISVVLRIRLQRVGRENKPNYRVVVAEHSSAVKKNKYVEQLGYYNPLVSEAVLKVDKDKLLEWIKKGAKPTDTIARLLKKDGVKGMEPYIVQMKDRKKKKVKEGAEGGAAPVESIPAEKSA